MATIEDDIDCNTGAITFIRLWTLFIVAITSDEFVLARNWKSCFKILHMIYLLIKCLVCTRWCRIAQLRKNVDKIISITKPRKILKNISELFASKDVTSINKRARTEEIKLGTEPPIIVATKGTIDPMVITSNIAEINIRVIVMYNWCKRLGSTNLKQVTREFFILNFDLLATKIETF